MEPEAVSSMLGVPSLTSVTTCLLKHFCKRHQGAQKPGDRLRPLRGRRKRSPPRAGTYGACLTFAQRSYGDSNLGERLSLTPGHTGTEPHEPSTILP